MVQIAPMQNLRQKIVDDIEAAGGRHDEPEIYGGRPGDPGIGGGPGSISWEINGDLASLVVGGTAAIIMEVLHPSVMAGVFTQSSYRTEPLRRARNTLGYVLRTTFGSTPAATDVIERVKKIHGMVGGVRADGVAYRALDPELIAWVHTCIPWAVMRAFESYNRPLGTAEKDRYLAEQAVIGRMGGADWVPETVSELDDYVEKMRPRLAFTAQTQRFVDFASGRSPEFPAGPVGRFFRRADLRAAMDLMPVWAQELTGTTASELERRLWLRPADAFKARLVRWACPEVPCKRMALERALA
jgi:uncharacterized protein (DUF2236 family)